MNYALQEQGQLTVVEYAAKFVELLRFAPDFTINEKGENYEVL